MVLSIFLCGLILILLVLMGHLKMQLIDCATKLKTRETELREVQKEFADADEALAKWICRARESENLTIDLKQAAHDAIANRKKLANEANNTMLSLRATIVSMLPALLLALTLGCSSGPTAASLDLVYVPNIEQPVPSTDLPESMRVTNWIGTDEDGSRGGSCVHASTINCFRSAGRFDLEEQWYQNRDNGYEGPEADFRLLEKLDKQGVPFAATDDGDIEVLEAASATGRLAVIFYYPSHSINFVEFNRINGQDVAVLLDNNFPEAYIVVPKDVFIDSWKNLYEGFAVVPWLKPNPERTFQRTINRKYLQNVYPTS